MGTKKGEAKSVTTLSSSMEECQLKFNRREKDYFCCSSPQASTSSQERKRTRHSSGKGKRRREPNRPILVELELVGLNSQVMRPWFLNNKIFCVEKSKPSGGACSILGIKQKPLKNCFNGLTSGKLWPRANSNGGNL